MKTLRLILGAALGLCLAAVSHASIGKVQQLNATGSSVICIPGPDCNTVIIQNTGSNAVLLSIDGGAGWTDPNTGKTGTNPTPTTGFSLAASSFITFTRPVNPVNSTKSGAQMKPIVAIMASSTTTLSIITDDTQSQFPTS